MSPAEHDHGITVHLNHLIEQAGITVTDLAERVGVTLTNLSILKNGRARAIRFSTLTALCRELSCTPGDILGYNSTHVAAQPVTDDHSCQHH